MHGEGDWLSIVNNLIDIPELRPEFEGVYDCNSFQRALTRSRYLSHAMGILPPSVSKQPKEAAAFLNLKVFLPAHLKCLVGACHFVTDETFCEDLLAPCMAIITNPRLTFEQRKQPAAALLYLIRTYHQPISENAAFKKCFESKLSLLKKQFDPTNITIDVLLREFNAAAATDNFILCDAVLYGLMNIIDANIGIKLILFAPTSLGLLAREANNFALASSFLEKISKLVECKVELFDSIGRTIIQRVTNDEFHINTLDKATTIFKNIADNATNQSLLRYMQVPSILTEEVDMEGGPDLFGGAKDY